MSPDSSVPGLPGILANGAVSQMDYTIGGLTHCVDNPNSTVTVNGNLLTVTACDSSTDTFGKAASGRL